MKALVINGPNLNLLGRREPEIYGGADQERLKEQLQTWGRELGLEVSYFQSNFEGQILERIHAAKEDFIVINPGALTHTSVALRDAISGVGKTTIEVHISNVYQREEFRRKSTISEVCLGVISGFGLLGYRLALEAGASSLLSE